MDVAEFHLKLLSHVAGRHQSLSTDRDWTSEGTVYCKTTWLWIHLSSFFRSGGPNETKSKETGAMLKRTLSGLGFPKARIRKQAKEGQGSPQAQGEGAAKEIELQCKNTNVRSTKGKT